MGQKVQILIGLPASSKSLYAKNAAETGFIIINDDSLIESLHCGNQQLGYIGNHNDLYCKVENGIIGLACQLGFSIVVDCGNNVNKERRKQIIDCAKKYNVPCEAIIFPLDDPKIHAERRYNDNSRGFSLKMWLTVVEKYAKLYSRPDENEGFAHIYEISFEQIQSGLVF